MVCMCVCVYLYTHTHTTHHPAWYRTRCMIRTWAHFQARDSSMSALSYESSKYFYKLYASKKTLCQKWRQDVGPSNITHKTLRMNLSPPCAPSAPGICSATHIRRTLRSPSASLPLSRKRLPEHNGSRVGAPPGAIDRGYKAMSPGIVPGSAWPQDGRSVVAR